MVSIRVEETKDFTRSLQKVKSNSHDILRTLKCAVSMMDVLSSYIIFYNIKLHKPDAGRKLSSAPQMPARI
ncbi:MAG: hypothetical protein ABIJ58_01385, partial [Nanoarchaeota archaeon]